MFSVSAGKDFLWVRSLPNDGSKQETSCWVPAHCSAPQTLLICFQKDVQGPVGPTDRPHVFTLPAQDHVGARRFPPRGIPQTGHLSIVKYEIRTRLRAARSLHSCVLLRPESKVSCVLRWPAEPPARETRLPRPPGPHTALPSGPRLSRDSRCGPTPTSSSTLLFPTRRAQGQGGRSPPGALHQVLLQRVLRGAGDTQSPHLQSPALRPELRRAASGAGGGQRLGLGHRRAPSRCVVWGLSAERDPLGAWSLTARAEAVSEGNRELLFQVDDAVYETVWGRIKERH